VISHFLWESEQFKGSWSSYHSLARHFLRLWLEELIIRDKLTVLGFFVYAISKECWILIFICQPCWAWIASYAHLLENHYYETSCINIYTYHHWVSIVKTILIQINVIIFDLSLEVKYS
jgi:hypothetical protein